MRKSFAIFFLIFVNFTWCAKKNYLYYSNFILCVFDFRIYFLLYWYTCLLYTNIGINVPQGNTIFGFLLTWDKNINNVHLKEHKNAFSCLSVFTKAGSCRFFLKLFFFFVFQLYTQRKI